MIIEALQREGRGWKTADRRRLPFSHLDCRRRAFTLLELVCVLAIIAVVVAIVVPILSHTARGREVADTATHVVTLSNYARMQSISEGRNYRLNFDPNGQGYWLTADRDGQFAELGNDFGQQFKTGDNVRVETDIPRGQDGTYVTFKPTGRTDPAPVNVRVRGEEGALVQVTCESATELFHVVVK